MSSVVWAPIDNGKLANQIARLAAIVVKLYLYFLFDIERLLPGATVENVTICGQ